jgi:hypothetical protein
MLKNLFAVIPGRRLQPSLRRLRTLACVVNPESRGVRKPSVWIPGSRLTARPGMTT